MGNRVAVLGATGAVGGELLKLIEERNFPFDTIRLLASSRSRGKKLKVSGKDVPVEVLTHQSFEGVDIVFSSAASSISKKYAPSAVESGAVVIDNTSCFRMDPEVPLVIPEINSHKINNNKGIIANPNCVAIILALPLFPLHRAFKAKRVFVSTYQAASGAGRKAMEELQKETMAVLEGRSFQRTVIPHQYAFNFFVHNSRLHENGYVDEEVKVIQEIRKIFDEPDFCINVVCIRVPVLRAHGEAVNIEFETDVSPEEAYHVLRNAPGVEILEDRDNNRWPMPVDASGRNPVYVGRIRRDVSKKILWISGWWEIRLEKARLSMPSRLQKT